MGQKLWEGLTTTIMWLIDTETLSLEFFASRPARYVILSHTWAKDNDEVSFQEIRYPAAPSQPNVLLAELSDNAPPELNHITPAEPNDNPIAKPDDNQIAKPDDNPLVIPINYPRAEPNDYPLAECNNDHKWGTPRRYYAYMEKSGYKKIQEFCRLAKAEGYRYAWIDTCCIDKKSSAELSETINSMFAWYKHSTACYAYLEDVESTSSTLKPDGKESRWYSRGWTLQELLAPLTVVFYNKSWDKIGTKWSLRQEISRVTDIDELNLIYYEMGRTSIAQKMSWAAKRETTREEDTAYCLLGLFGIHMPLLYGEGKNAFRRLQEELIKTSADQSILAWAHPVWEEAFPWGILANSPASFENCGSISYSRKALSSSERHLFHPDRSFRHNRLSYTLTNTGLYIELPIITQPNFQEFQIRGNSSLSLDKLLQNGEFGSFSSGVRHVVAILDCFDVSTGAAIGIILTGYEKSSTFHRWLYEYLVDASFDRLDRPDGWHEQPISVSLETEWLIPHGPHHLSMSKYVAQVFIHPESSLHKFRLLSKKTNSEIRQVDGSFCMKLDFGTAAALDLVVEDQRCAVCFGVFGLDRHRRRHGSDKWVVRCSIVTNLPDAESLDSSKKLLEYKGTVRNAQDGIWVEYLLKNKPSVIVSVFGPFAVGGCLQDLIYISCNDEYGVRGLRQVLYPSQRQGIGGPSGQQEVLHVESGE